MGGREKERTGGQAGRGAAGESVDVLEPEVLEPEALEPEADRARGETEDLGHGYFEEEDLAAMPATDLVESGPLQQYMAEVSRYPLIPQEEEVRLARKYREEGDLRAAYTLVLANLRLVVKIAYEFRRNFSNLMDLIQEGNIGLMRAVEKFDPYRGVKLSSYSAWWIRAYIIRYVLNNWSLVKVGTTQNQRRLFFNLKKVKRELEAEGFRPEPKLIASRLNVREDEVIEMEKRLSGSDVSLDAPVEPDSDSSRMDFVADTGGDVSEQLADRELRQQVRAKLREFREGLEERERAIFDQRLLAEEPVTLRELGEQFGVSRERVRQLEADLKRRLRDFLTKAEGLGEALRG
ncbi:MAG: RNA polymerase factor sigma-32 [Deferrisomatales bacterium]|nr:RNA polymerase factor sigma-32 [Deferrisomatales bacterium]